MKEILKDNGGWGIKDEFIIIAVLVLALVVSVFLINRNFSEEDLTEYQLTTEEVVLNASISYVEEFYGVINSNDELLIRHQTLVDEGYLNEDKLDDCDWFVKIIGDEYDAYNECG